MNKPKRGIADYEFNIGTNKQATEYEIASKFIINYIKQTFEMGNNIAETLQTLTIQNTDKWMPKLKGSKVKDAETKLLENTQNQIEYKTLLDKAVKRKNKYHENIYKTYAFLWKNVVEPCKTN